jgi:predicted DNA-binding protein
VVLKLPPEIHAELAREARRAHKPIAALLRRAVEVYLGDLADARAVEMARSRGGKAIPWAEVKRRQGLAG